MDEKLKEFRKQLGEWVSADPAPGCHETEWFIGRRAGWLRACALFDELLPEVSEALYPSDP